MATFRGDVSRLRYRLAALALLAWFNACGDHKSSSIRPGDPSLRGGSPTIRRPFATMPDNPQTTNDESNDQPRGYFGSVTVTVTSAESGNTYTLDADADGGTVSRIYFPKGGWVDFPDCELDSDFTGDCEDEQGRAWSFEGSSSMPSPAMSEDSDNEEDEGDSED